MKSIKHGNITAGHFAGLCYSVTSYLLCLATLFYLTGFLSRLWVPKHIDSGGYYPWASALLVDVALISLFALQHSVMARQSVKARLARWLPAPIERATYVLFSSLALILLFYGWRPITLTLWHVESPVLRGLLAGLYWFGWGLVVLATFLISHFELFGIKQALLPMLKPKPRLEAFITPSLYRFVRHPMYLGFLFTFWATPDMTLGHLVFAVTSTLYILIGTHLEERDLLRIFGKKYQDYQRKVGMLLPFR